MKRQPTGIPTGGQFAASARSEADVPVTATPPGFRAELGQYGPGRLRSMLPSEVDKIDYRAFGVPASRIESYDTGDEEISFSGCVVVDSDLEVRFYGESRFRDADGNPQVEDLTGSPGFGMDLTDFEFAMANRARAALPPQARPLRPGEDVRSAALNDAAEALEEGGYSTYGYHEGGSVGDTADTIVESFERSGHLDPDDRAESRRIVLENLEETGHGTPAVEWISAREAAESAHQALGEAGKLRTGD